MKNNGVIEVDKKNESVSCLWCKKNSKKEKGINFFWIGRQYGLTELLGVDKICLCEECMTLRPKGANDES